MPGTHRNPNSDQLDSYMESHMVKISNSISRKLSVGARGRDNGVSQQSGA